jgi:hypothetical protein
MVFIDRLISGIDLQSVAQRVLSIATETEARERRFFFLESKVKAIGMLLSRKINRLHKQRARLLERRPLTIMKRNPLLDPRDDKHVICNKRLSEAANA